MGNRSRGLSVRCPLCGASVGDFCRHPLPGDWRVRGGSFPEPSAWTGTERRAHADRVKLEDTMNEAARRARVEAAGEMLRRAEEEGRARRAERLAHLHRHYPRFSKGES